MDTLFDALLAPKHEDLLLQRAKQQFPMLNQMQLGYKNTPGKYTEGGNQLESWPAGEPGTPDRPRPQDFPLNRFGIENYNPHTRPIDLMGDVASHQLRYTDPLVKRTYEQFEASLTPEQNSRLKAQYQDAKTQEGETRSFEQWREHTGLPAYFRGYAFQQWDQPERLYTQEQRRSFDQMMGYLRGAQSPRQSWNPFEGGVNSPAGKAIGAGVEAMSAASQFIRRHLPDRVPSLTPRPTPAPLQSMPGYNRDENRQLQELERNP
jgi:hypothetical protein